MIDAYYRLAKPGIIYGNGITAAAGFLLASHGTISLPLFIATIAGLSLVVASACVFNNLLDRDIDAQMERTKDRALVVGTIPTFNAIAYGSILGISGFILLIFHVNLLAACVSFFGFAVYLGFYTPLKRVSVHATLVGALAGAVPPVLGYAAVANTVDRGAILLFAILILWQMPHFFAIGIYRLQDYAAASIPILPVKSICQAKTQIVLYIIAFGIAALSLFAYGYVGRAYFIVMTLLCVAWLSLALALFRTDENSRAARKVFLFSLVVILAWSALIAFDFAK
ncbi:protoheme IX farnesyltransferase [Candidatus Kaiserbacteria bacterium]|nr:protoheme IX farnesyltransferase [Candidatus Kaiserbacteria bacterium]